MTSEAPQAYGPNRWVEIHTQATSLLQQAAVTLAPFAGLSSNALAHLRSDWITWKDEFVQIRVPTTAECNQWKLGGGQKKPHLSPRNQPCSYCRGTGDTNGFENLWIGSSGSDPRRYTATLHRELAAPAVELLRKVFQTWGRPEIAATPDGVGAAADQLVDESTDTHAYPKLRRTGVVLYCHYGLTESEIADVTPYTQTTIRDIEGATPEISRGHNNSYLYLRVVAANEPVSVPALEEEFDVAQDTIRKTLKGLEKEGRVEVNKNNRPHTWSTVENWQEPFTCDICGYQSATLKGISTHKRQAHD